MAHSRSRQAFTLMELLVVISLIALLASLLLPSTRLIQASARSFQCQTRQRAAFGAYVDYARDNRGLLPRQVQDGQSKYVSVNPCAGGWMHHPIEMMCPEVLRGTVICRRGGLESAEGQAFFIPTNAEPYPCFQRPCFGLNLLVCQNTTRFDYPIGYWPKEHLPPSQALLVGDSYGWIIYDSPENAYTIYPHKGRCNAVCFDGHGVSFNLPQTLNYLVGVF